MSTIQGTPWPQVRAKIEADAVKSFPNASDPAEAVALMASNLAGAVAERNAEMNRMTSMASTLASAYLERDKLRLENVRLSHELDAMKGA